MKKVSTVRVNGNMIFKGHKLTIGVDLGDRWSCYINLPKNEPLNAQTDSSNQAQLAATEPSTLS